MVGDFVAMLGGDLMLQTLNLFADKLDYRATFDIHHVIVVMPLCELKHGMSTFEMVPRNQPRCLELGEYTINRRQANIFAGTEQMTINIFCALVTGMASLKNLENLEARQGHFKPGFAQVLVFHSISSVDVVSGMSLPDAWGIIARSKIQTNLMSLSRAFLLFAACLVLAACVFRLPTVQGNVIEQAQVDQLEIGMTPDQVRFLLGTPLVQGSFDPNRWDYVYYFRSSRGEETQRSLNLYFENAKLARIVGQEAPTNAKQTVNPGETPTPTTVPKESSKDNTPLPDRDLDSNSEEKGPLSLP